LKFHIILSLLFTFYLFLISCKQESVPSYTYHHPEQINDGFTVGTFSDVNIDSGLISQAMDSILQGRYSGVHSILIYKDNRLVFEEYFNGHQFRYDTTKHHSHLVTWDKTMLHRIMSVTKSITSICIGIAIDKGFIKDVRQSIFDYLPEYQHFKTDGKDKITIEHLLTMTSGLKGNEWLMPYSNPENAVMQIYNAQDPIASILDVPLIYKPGEFFQYYGGSNFLLSKILENATKMNLEEFAKKYLFIPLGIKSYYWFKLNKEVVDGAGGLMITPRAMAQIGVTYLNNGIWNGNRIISEQWIAKSAASYTGNSWINNWDDHWGMKGYAYSWWTHTFTREGKRIDMYYAAGWGGQYIMVIPDLNTVVVFTGGNYTTPRPCFNILKKYILPSFN
jgi:CubicO group peptidase (beta-lactamase class C family)